MLRAEGTYLKLNLFVRTHKSQDLLVNLRRSFPSIVENRNERGCLMSLLFLSPQRNFVLDVFDVVSLL